MKKHTLLQSFAINNIGELVSVREVARGKACACCCPGCGEVLIARQGEVRAWHFAHESGAECGGAAESALHLAAKHIILREAIVMTPAMEISAHRTLPDGRRGSGMACLPAALHDLHGVQLEASVGAVRPDVYAYTDDGQLIVEIAVTHPVDLEKSALLEQTGIAAMEIKLIPDLFQEWTWESLKDSVVNDPRNRHWIFYPEKAHLTREAEEAALAAAEAEPPVRQTMQKQTRLHLNGVPTYLSDYPWGFSVWYPYNDRTYAVVKSVAARFGGRWKPKYRNWAFPPGVREAVEAELV